MKSKCQFSILFIIFCASVSLVFQSEANRSSLTSNKDFLITNDNDKPNQVIFPPMVSNAIEFSNYNLSVVFDESTSSVMGNLTVDFYNNDFVNFTRIPFHLFLSGMLYDTRQGNIEILNVTTISVPKTILSYDVNTPAQLLWVDLETILEPYQRTYFEIQFNSTIPDGGYDRANSHGNDYDSSKIFKFTSFYPMPCVYDKFDGWNIDPYLNACDPFYYDMAYYNLAIEAPNGMIIAGSGKLIEKSTGTSTTAYLFDPELPVREVTFAASRYYQVETMLFKGVNISTYYLPKSSYIWQIDALNYARLSLSLYNDTFGEYQYSNLNLVQEYASTYLGMEYPIQMYASEIIDHYAYPTNVLKQILEKVIVHEVGHQWWYNLVGFDEVDWGFLDEGLTCWTTDYYAEIIHSNWEYFQWDRYLDTVRIYYETNGLPSKLNQSAYDLIENHLDHVFISYRKSPLIFEKIRRIIGDSNFILGLQTFFNQYKYSIAMLSDLQQVFENILGRSLDWLFFPFFDNDYLPKYSFTECIFDRNQKILNVSIEDVNEGLNDYEYSQQVLIRVYDSVNTTIYFDWFWINGTTTVSIPFNTETPNKVRLDYDNDVLVQLESLNKPYIEMQVNYIGGIGEETTINGYQCITIFVFGFLAVIGLLKRIKSKRKRVFKI